jgi:NAD(P)-dependent dehydrogenase (short-subunit alcohol dehydrogenase family)
MSSLAGKFALVTGGNSGIGLATAKLFAAAGAHVAIAGRDPVTLATATGALGPSSIAIPGDITDARDRERLFAAIRERFGALDILFANAGMSGPTPLGSTSEETFEKLVQLNFTSVFFTVQGALPLLRDGASIVLTGSITSVIGIGGNAAYAGSKAAVRAMARVLAAELSPRNIRVNVVTPGYTRTPLWDRTRTPEQIAATSSRVSQIVPLGRWSDAEEVARVAFFLASGDASYLQGAEIVVDGGVSNLPGGTPAFRG